MNMMAFIGIIMLAGIAVNNSILLVDAANRLKAEGFALTEAIKGAAQQRIRPNMLLRSGQRQSRIRGTKVNGSFEPELKLVVVHSLPPL